MTMSKYSQIQKKINAAISAHIGRVIKESRESMGMSRHELAIRLGRLSSTGHGCKEASTFQTLTNLENGETRNKEQITYPPRVLTLYMIAATLNLKMSELLPNVGAVLKEIGIRPVEEKIIVWDAGNIDEE